MVLVVEADWGCRRVFSWETVLDAETLYSRECPNPTFPGVMERAPGLETCRVTPFAWLDLSFLLCEVEFLSSDCSFASSLAVPGSDDRWWRAGSVPYDQFSTQTFGPLNPLTPASQDAWRSPSLDMPLRG